MNILLTSVGRRAYMVKYFKQAVAPDGEVHVCNSDDMTVAFRYADQAVVSPMIYDNAYIPFLLEYCKTHQIDLLLSLFDIDLPVLARYKEAFEAIGTRVIVSDAAFVDNCSDKWQTAQYLASNGFDTPRTWLTLEDTLRAIRTGELSYPVIVKPRFGCGSIALEIAEDEEELRYLTRRCLRRVESSYLQYESAAEEHVLVFQECLQGQEYGADVINDLDGCHVATVVRRKFAMRAGETDIAEVIDHPGINAICQRLGRLTGHIGNLDCDLFVCGERICILEMNARFGGGYPFSHMAGCDLPGAIIRWAKGLDVPEDMLRAQTGVLGYKELITTRA